MRKSYYEHAERIRTDIPLWREIEAYGEPPVNIKPSKIHDQHNKLGKIISIMTNKKTIEDYDAEIKKIKENEAEDIEYTNGKYSILLPDNANDIIREGRILHHCVGHGGYIQKMAHKKCRILFLRDILRLNEPLLTIEEYNGKIRQCYGLEDRINTDEEIKEFIEEFALERGWGIDATIYLKNPAPVRAI